MLRVLALLDRLAAVHQHALEIAEGDVGRGQQRRHRCEKAHAVIVGKDVLGKIRAHHDVAHRGEREPGMRGRGHGWFRGRGRGCRRRRSCRRGRRLRGAAGQQPQDAGRTNRTVGRAAHGHSPTRMTSGSRSARAQARVQAIELGQVGNRANAHAIPDVFVDGDALHVGVDALQLELRARAIRHFLLAIRSGLQHVNAGPFDGDRRVVALARDFAILLRHHHFEVRQHVVEVVVLRAVLEVAGGRVLVGSGFGPRYVADCGGGILLAVVLPDQHEQRQGQAERQADAEFAPAAEVEAHAAGAAALEIPAGDLGGQGAVLPTCSRAPKRRGFPVRYESPAARPVPA